MFLKKVEYILFDESGYFICRSWWENPCTMAVMAIGEEQEAGTSVKDILQNAVEILTKERAGNHAGGQAAFDVWAEALSGESQFPKDAVLPLLFERLMCQGDAMDMIAEGRYYAGCFMEWLSGQNQNIKSECLEAAVYFKREFPVINKMSEYIGGGQRGEEQARRLADPAVRKEIVKLIMEAKELDLKACSRIKEIIGEL